MSLQAQCSKHTVTVLEPTETQGRQMGRNVTFEAADPPRVLVCTVEEQDGGVDYNLLREKGIMKLYLIYFATRPTNLDERRRLRHENKTLRVTSPVENVQELDRMWQVHAEAHSDDNPNVSME